MSKEVPYSFSENESFLDKVRNADKLLENYSFEACVVAMISETNEIIENGLDNIDNSIRELSTGEIEKHLMENHLSRHEDMVELKKVINELANAILESNE